jgi:4-diphosphocytidyl-2-C-methyl-D-erythritol kinase
LTLALPARAKLNLTLRVLGRRPDGSHDLMTVLQAISLHDLLIARVADSSSPSSLRVEGAPIPVEGNLVLRAVAALERAAGRALPTSFRLVKRIPAGAGLGGGSSDAAAALRVTSALHRLQVPLGPVASELGADVPFFLRGGAAGAFGRGERLAPAPHLPAWWAVAWPRFTLSTGAVYNAWDEADGPGGAGNDLLRAASAVEPRLREFAARLGDGWRMTGSGSAFFRHCDSRGEAETALTGVDGWTAVAYSVPAWG